MGEQYPAQCVSAGGWRDAAGFENSWWRRKATAGARPRQPFARRGHALLSRGGNEASKSKFVTATKAPAPIGFQGVLEFCRIPIS